MSFADDLRAFRVKTLKRQDALLVNAAEKVRDSIVIGSPITGAPGQPMQTGELRRSWKLQYTGEGEATISTQSPYARAIEHGARGAVVRSNKGGFHSVKLTVVGWQRIVSAALREVSK